MQDVARFRDLTIGGFVERLASAEPVPGGGSASAVAGSLAAALVSMVAQLSRRQQLVAHSRLHDWAEGEGQRLAALLLQLADEDAAAYGAFAAALKMPRATPEESEARQVAKRRSARVAAEVPLRTVEACLDVVKAAEALAGRCNLNASSDVAVASLLAEAAAEGAAENVRVNLPSLGDDPWAEEVQVRLEELLAELQELAESCRATVSSGAMREPIGLIAAP
ncbi:MAG TPA: cyclodeaminase/cyclohydrolase family protein [Candidatus Limnocylindrales bacterium]|nr:cyclodeaminase/cyclohydrolase family protein [Candidatus Limnocylindrales bacterium]